MKLTVLTENTACRQGLQAVHGLSLYLETSSQKLLMDVGPGDEFLRNAQRLGVPVEAVELCVISHGHHDHGGGLGAFLECNHHASVYIRDRAFLPYYSGEKYIGLDRSLMEHPQVKLVGERTELGNGVLLLSEIPGDVLLPAANGNLLDENGADSFRHEQVMLVEEQGTLLLLGGCAHRGIVNILNHVRETLGRYPDVVVSGFHLAAGGQGACMADEAYLDSLAERLLDTGAMFYTCHCTGAAALEQLKTRMGDRLEGISAGTVLNI